MFKLKKEAKKEKVLHHEIDFGCMLWKVPLANLIDLNDEFFSIKVELVSTSILRFD